MKKFALALTAVFVLAIACGGGTPDQVVQKYIDAAISGNGDGVVSCLSSQSIEELDGFIEHLRANPETSMEQFASIGVEFTADEIENLTAGQFLTAKFGNEEASASMPDPSDVTIGETVISEDGQTATVSITVDDDEINIELVLEEGKWKISDLYLGNI